MRTGLFLDLQLEQLLELPDGVIGIGDRMSNRPGVTVYLVVISAGEALVAKEMDIFVFDSGDLLLCLDVAETISLVPSSGEDVE